MCICGFLEGLGLMLFGSVIRARFFVPDEYSLLVTSFIIVGLINLVAYLTKCGESSSALIGFTVLKSVVIVAQGYYALVFLNVIETDKWYYEYFQLMFCGEHYIDGKLLKFLVGNNPCAKRVNVLGYVCGAFCLIGVVAVLIALNKLCSSKKKAPVYVVVRPRDEDGSLA
ncbi:hypothetical protein O0L34_g9894 [Tuta absoluta]|nr:hypothetical protein O0L34_g9894 [Tuta absoluta]